MVEICVGNRYISNYPLVSIKKEPNQQAEQTTQLLYGDSFVILELAENWCYIEIEFDKYRGWMDKKLFWGDIKLESEYPSKKKWINPYPMFYNDKLIPAGCFIVLDEDSHSFQNDTWNYASLLKHFSIEKIARIFLNSPYQWGGKTHWGIDCSGLVQQVFKIMGFTLPRDAYQQELCGLEVTYGSHQKNDLAFFHENGKITHVGILLNENEIIHAHGHVRIDYFCEKGIFNKKINKKTHTLIRIKRIL
jgi:hypothetical protein